MSPDHLWWSDTEVRRSPETYTKCPECGWGGRTDARAVREGRTEATPRAVSTHRGRVHHIKTPSVVEYRGEYVRTRDFGYGHRLLVAAPADSDGARSLSSRDARLIAWLQGDGHLSTAYGQAGVELVCNDCQQRAFATLNGYRVHRAKVHGEPGLGSAGAAVPVGWDGVIYQSKPKMMRELRKLLVDVPHTEDVRVPRSPQQMPQHVFRLRRSFVTQLIRACPDVVNDPQAFVLSLSTSQCKAWLDAMIDAEGHRMPGRKPGWAEFIRIAQVDGPLQDAIKLAVYLQGHRPTYSPNTAASRGFKPAGTVGMAGPHIAPSMFDAAQLLPVQPAWSVHTNLGTWSARVRGQIFLTGSATTD